MSRLFKEGELPIAGEAGARTGAAAERKKGAQFITVAAQHKEQVNQLTFFNRFVVVLIRSCK